MTVYSMKQIALASGLMAAVVAGGAGVAVASGEPSSMMAGGTATTSSSAGRLAAAKHRADVRLAKAAHRLALTTARVHRGALTAPDRALLDGELTALAAELAAERAQVEGVGTRQQLRAALRMTGQLMQQGRVISVQVRQLAAADQATAFVARIDMRLGSVSARVAALPTGSPARAALADVQIRLADATAQAARISTADRRLDVKDPAAARAVLAANRASLQALRSDRRAVVRDRKQLLAAVRSR